jgi:hypothetical protein
LAAASDPVVIVSAARTPLGRFMGDLSPFSAHKLIVDSHETKSSLIVQLRSGMTPASPLNRVIAAAWSTHSPSLPQDSPGNFSNTLLRGLLLAGGALLRREYALVCRARLSNKTRAFKLRLRDKSYDFAHGLSETNALRRDGVRV